MIVGYAVNPSYWSRFLYHFEGWDDLREAFETKTPLFNGSAPCYLSENIPFGEIRLFGTVEKFRQFITDNPGPEILPSTDESPF